jgi:hypothetical protein
VGLRWGPDESTSRRPTRVKWWLGGSVAVGATKRYCLYNAIIYIYIYICLQASTIIYLPCLGKNSCSGCDFFLYFPNLLRHIYVTVPFSFLNNHHRKINFPFKFLFFLHFLQTKKMSHVIVYIFVIDRYTKYHQL